ncbi:MAG: PIN domain-containing protein, partial [Rhodospirillales bacterium]|nr:PIN domain-containing protein [Rhodospirillales bacterium]
PCRKVGAHRRVRAADIVAYRRETESRRRSALEELPARDQELGLQQPMARRRALLDADALYPAGLRNLLLRLADRYLFTPLWSADIHAEWTRSLLADRLDLDAAVLTRTRSVMDGHFPQAIVTGYAALAGDLGLPDPGDRHVLAAAIRGQADVIVTRNLRDFPADRVAPHTLVAEHPDAFLAGLAGRSRSGLVEIGPGSGA